MTEETLTYGSSGHHKKTSRASIIYQGTGGKPISTGLAVVERS